MNTSSHLHKEQAMTLRRVAISALALGVALSVATARADDEKGKGVIKGVAKYDAPPVKPGQIQMGQDPVCMKAHGGKAVPSQTGLVFPDGTVPYVFVYVKSGLKGKYTAPKENAVI